MGCLITTYLPTRLQNLFYTPKRSVGTQVCRYSYERRQEHEEQSETLILVYLGHILGRDRAQNHTPIIIRLHQLETELKIYEYGSVPFTIEDRISEISAAHYMNEGRKDLGDPIADPEGLPRPWI